MNVYDLNSLFDIYHIVEIDKTREFDTNRI